MCVRVCVCVCVGAGGGRLMGATGGRKLCGDILSKNGADRFGEGQKVLWDALSFWGRYAGFMLTAFAQQGHAFIKKKKCHHMCFGRLELGGGGIQQFNVIW